MATTETPLLGPSPAEVPLKNAPLVRVIGQVRFPVIASLAKRDFIGPFQEAIRSDYPILRPEQNRAVILGPQGMMESGSNTVWRFHDAKSHWRVTLAPEFLAIETTQYLSREDFLSRFKRVLEALQEHVDPAVIDRLGMRYIDRVIGANLEDLRELVRPEVAGILATPLASDAQHSIVESLFTLTEDAGQLRARWGIIPANGTVDPSAVDAIGERSWLLDLDAFAAFVGETHAFEIDTLISEAEALAKRIYSVFRWAVTDEFLTRYGGQV